MDDNITRRMTVPSFVDPARQGLNAYGVSECGPVRAINQDAFRLPAMLVSLVGAVILLAIVNLFRRGRVR